MTYCCICGQATKDGADVHGGECADRLAEIETTRQLTTTETTR